MPDHISDEAAATALIGTLTAMGLVQEAAVPKVPRSTRSHSCTITPDDIMCVGQAGFAKRHMFVTVPGGGGGGGGRTCRVRALDWFLRRPTAERSGNKWSSSLHLVGVLT